MKFTKFGVMILVIIVFFSILVARVSNIITVISDKNYVVKSKESSNSDNVIIRDSLDNLIWFLQISDLHISVFHDKSRLTDFQEFCDKTINTIKPSVVLASGDLTDAKNRDNVGSKQYEGEWKQYKLTLDKYKVTDKTIWLDVRGNHDNFNVPSPISKENYYRTYSIQGNKNPKSYLHQVKDRNGNLYSFIALDTCSEAGPRRPFNFMGFLTEKEIDHVKALSDEAAKGVATIWFGHYPTSCILSSNKEYGVRSLIGETGTAYLCGHLHTLGGLIPNMYTVQHNGFLELELADWKVNRKYRVGAIDHGLFSFTDVGHGEWPVVLVTNPKSALLSLPQKEPMHRLLKSTHIRVLAFSLDNIVHVKVRLVGDKEWTECAHSGGPLYTSIWNPADFQTGLNSIEVHVKDEFGREKIITHSFSLDGTRPVFPVMPRLVLMLDLYTVFHVLFGLAVIGSVLPLCIIRCMNNAIKVRRISRRKFFSFLVQNFFCKLWVLANLDVFFFALVLYPLYISVGPWIIGEIIEDHVGVVFAWGIFVNGYYIPESFTYVYGFVQMLVFHVPLVLYLAHHLERRTKERSRPNNNLQSSLLYLWSVFPFIVIISFQVLLIYGFWLEYGGMAMILGPIRLWSIVFAVCLFSYAHVISETTIRNTIDSLYCTSVSVTVTNAEGNVNHEPK